MKAIQSKRRMEKAAITRACTFINNAPGELDADVLDARRDRLEAAWKELELLTGELYKFEDEAGFTDPEGEMGEYEEKYVQCMGWFRRMIKSFVITESTSDPHMDMFSRLAEQHSTLIQRLDSTSIQRNDDLPKLRIEPFAGSYKEWPAFKDLFVSAIDSKPNLSNIQKFQYLKSLVKDEAANLIKHIQMAEGSYVAAWDRLKERFDRPRQIVTSYIETFMGLPSLKEENSIILRQISDTSNEVIRGLEAVGYNERDHWLIYILQNKLDGESRRKWIEKSRDDPKPTINIFLKFLDQCCEELELGKHKTFRGNDAKRKLSTSLIATSPVHNCADCGSDDHQVYNCPHFASLSIEQRRLLVKGKNLCFNCLRCGHTAYNCKSQNRCRSCQRNHHTLVHPMQAEVRQAHIAALPGSSADSQVANASQQVSLNAVISKSGTSSERNKSLTHILPTALVDVRDFKGNFIKCRLLLDTASELSYITEDCFKRLGLPRNSSKIALSGISTVKAESTRGNSHIYMRSRNSHHTINAQVHILGRITSLLPRGTINDYNRTDYEGVSLADPSFYLSNPIDILLGVDYVWDVMTQQKLMNKNGSTIAISTVFGWVVTSVVSSLENPHSSSSLLTLVDIDRSLESFWRVEEMDNEIRQSDELAIVEKHFKETHRRHSDGRYVVELPFREKEVTFADTFKGALARFNSTERRLLRNPTLRDNYKRFINEYQLLGHMRQLSSEEINNTDGRVFYLPHHPVIGTKLRVVFDGSFQDVNQNSLNDKLHIGPSIQRNLFAVCFRFRLHKVVFSADIVKMFRQIWVTEEHRNFQRILWRDNPNDTLKHYQLCTVTYGTASAPYLSVRVLEQIANDYKRTHPNASKILLEDFYVDDVLTGASSPEELMMKRKELVDLLSLAGLELSKWKSNCKEISAPSTDEQLPLIKDDNDATKVLGIFWSPNDDCIQYKLNLEETAVATKRRVLSEVSRIFDPLGLISPVVVKFKIMFQELWLLNVEWDEQLPPKIANLWTMYRDDLQNLSALTLPRYVPNSTAKMQLHGFSDASLKAYAAVVYCKMEDETGNIFVNLLASKTRVAPLKQISLPRLELCGALLLARLIKCVTSSLHHQQMQITAWTDSTVVLSWLSMQPTKLKTFVGNRTAEILETLPRNVWKHVSTKNNPADFASRGLMANQLSELDMWWSGPRFLKTENPVVPFNNGKINLEDEAVQAEVKLCMRTNAKISLVNATQHIPHPLESVLERVSHWYRLVRIAAYVKRFLNHSIYKIKPPAKYLTYHEIQEGKVICIKMAQTCFLTEKLNLLQGKELNNHSKLVKLSPFVDDNGILRVGGRISKSELSVNTQHPIILAKDHKITKLILNEEHVKNLHPGVSALLVIVRQHYWIIGARNLIRSLTHKCIKCFRYTRQVTQQRMADLPQFRVTQSFPFQHTGCDYAGPFTLKIHPGRNSKTSKGYVCLFICMVTSAIHLELVSNLTTDCFLAALRRFMARRGKCSTIYSDNGKTFVGAKRNLNEMFQHLQAEDHQQQITETLAKENINWVFIPPYSPHWGGMWESGVRSVKLHLRRVVGSTILTFEQMHTLLAQIEAVINSRPLGYSSDTDVEYLSPSHFLLGRPATMVYEGNLTAISSNRLVYWQHVQCMFQGFWRKWRTEYLTSLQQRPKWTKIQPNIAVNDVVLIKDDNAPPAIWSIGRVIETFPGSDGLTRAVRLKTSHGSTTRSIAKIVKLPSL